MRRGGKASASSSEEEGELQASKRELQASKQGNWKQERELQSNKGTASRCKKNKQAQVLHQVFQVGQELAGELFNLW